MSSQNDNPVFPSVTGHPVEAYVLAAFAAVVIYNALELLVLCLATFKRRGSFYFWCLVITSTSLIPHCVGFLILFFHPDFSPYASVTLIIIGWCGTVTGHSLVLWSRLHLVLQNPRLLNGLLALIIVDAVLLHIPITVLIFEAVKPHPDSLAVAYSVMERVQLVVFCVQECIISGVYIWETVKLLRLRPERQHHRILAQLLIINIVVLVLDIVVVGIEYAGFYDMQVMFKSVAYSIKLKLEYAVLGRLVQIASGGSSSAEGFGAVPSLEDGLPSRTVANCLLQVYDGDTYFQGKSSRRLQPSC